MSICFLNILEDFTRGRCCCLFLELCILFLQLTQLLLQRFYLVRYFLDLRCLESRSDSLERLFFLTVGFKSFLAGDRQDTTSSRSDPLFFDNLENTDFRSIAYVGSSAKLDRVVADGYDTNFFTIFFSKERHGTHFLSFVNICLYCLDSKGFPDFLIDFLLNSAQLFCCHRLEMRKVKAQEFYFVQRACLGCMVTKNIMQGCM